MSARSMVQNGPARCWVRSTILIFCSADPKEYHLVSVAVILLVKKFIPLSGSSVVLNIVDL